MVKCLPRCTAKVIGHKIAYILQFYSRGGFVIQMGLMDMKFKAVSLTCPMLPINITATNKHMPEIEHTVKEVKDHVQWVYNTLPFTEGIPKLMTIELICFVILWFNAFPVKAGISTKFSPRELVQCPKLSANIHYKTLFRTYCVVYDKPDPSNSMQGWMQ